jgi:hypothetical protein
MRHGRRSHLVNTAICVAVELLNHVCESKLALIITRPRTSIAELWSLRSALVCCITAQRGCFVSAGFSHWPSCRFRDKQGGHLHLRSIRRRVGSSPFTSSVVAHRSGRIGMQSTCNKELRPLQCRTEVSNRSLITLDTHGKATQPVYRFPTCSQQMPGLCESTPNNNSLDLNSPTGGVASRPRMYAQQKLRLRGRILCVVSMNVYVDNRPATIASRKRAGIAVRSSYMKFVAGFAASFVGISGTSRSFTFW